MSFQASELRQGLWRWEVRHPGWEQGEPESPYDWPPEVGSVAWRSEDELLFVDPLVPPGEEHAFWDFADGLASGSQAVGVVTTISFHRRSGDELAARYGARRDEEVAGAKLLRPPGAGETLVWIPEHRALIPGDSLIGAAGGGVRLCPASWLEHLGTGIDLDGMRKTLQHAIAALPVEMVLVSHGAPVLERGREAVAAALAS